MFSKMIYSSFEFLPHQPCSTDDDDDDRLIRRYKIGPCERNYMQRIIFPGIKSLPSARLIDLETLYRGVCGFAIMHQYSVECLFLIRTAVAPPCKNRFNSPAAK